jgi:tRNA A37 threonylcarbamoyladenosine synthetase subunit TsaC/SUA5/YrdC
VTSPVVVGARAAQVRSALHEERVIALPGVGGYQLVARHGGPGVPSLVALAAGASGGVPYFAVGRMAQAGQLTEFWSDEVRRVAIRFWPGPVLIIVGDNAPVRLTMPALRPVRHLCRSIGPLVMAAACDSSGQPLRDAEGLRARFSGTEVALVVDGGTLEGLGPSLLDCRVSPPAIRQEGALPSTYIEAALMVGGRRKRRSRS